MNILRLETQTRRITPLNLHSSRMERRVTRAQWLSILSGMSARTGVGIRILSFHYRSDFSIWTQPGRKAWEMSNSDMHTLKKSNNKTYIYLQELFESFTRIISLPKTGVLHHKSILGMECLLYKNKRDGNKIPITIVL